MIVINLLFRLFSIRYGDWRSSLTFRWPSIGVCSRMLFNVVSLKGKTKRKEDLESEMGGERAESDDDRMEFSEK